MKKSLLAFFSLFNVLLANAGKVQVDNLYYILDTENGTAQVTYSVDKPFGYDQEDYNYSFMPETIIVPASVSYLGSDYAVTSIGKAAFCGAKHLVEVQIPSTVISIERNAFQNCRNLRKVNIPAAVSSIGHSAFYNCESLSSVEGESLDSWCAIEFEDCYSNPMCYTHQLNIAGEQITELQIPASVSRICNYAFAGSNIASVSIPTTVTSIGDGAFMNCEGLTRIEVPSSVATIGQDVFNHCTSLESISLPAMLSELGKHAMVNCTNLKDIEIPEAITEIGDRTFYGCTTLKSVKFNSRQQLQLGGKVFEKCNALEDVYCDTNEPPVAEDFDVFESQTYSAATLHVPDKDYSLYTSTTPWSRFLNIVSLSTGETLGINYVDLNENEEYMVVNHQGIIVKQKARREDLKNLDKGIYIFINESTGRRFKMIK